MVRKVNKRKPLRKQRRSRKLVNSIHRYIRFADVETVFSASGPNTIVAAAGAQHLGYSFDLKNVVNYNEFVALYDQYRINKVTLYLEPLYDQISNLGGVTGQRLRIVHDYNDNVPLTTEDEYLEYSNCKSFFPFSKRVIKVVLYPKIGQEIMNVGGGLSQSALSSNKVWLNTDYTEVPHFGVKIYVPPYPAAPATTIYKVRARFNLSFKNSK